MILDGLARRTLDSVGWVTLPDVPERCLIDVANELGRVGEVTTLTPKHASVGGAASLSGRHGLAAFPFHTDGASRPNPPAYIALWSERTWQTATLLVDGAAKGLRMPLFSKTWVVSRGGGQRAFYAIPRLLVRGRVQWRLNTDCMVPATGVSTDEEVDRLLRAAQPVRVPWSAGSAVIIDNRRILHAREAISPGESDRELVRVEVLDDMVR